MHELDPDVLVLVCSFAIGVGFGAVGQRTHFCTMGALSDALLFGSRRRLCAWLLAIATALIATQLAGSAGLVDLGESRYLGPRLSWLAIVAGGLAFGFGMVLTGGCVSRNLVLLGAGSLKALVVLLLVGLFAYMALGGLLAAARLWLMGVAAVDVAAFGSQGQDLASLLAAALGTDAATPKAALVAGIGGGLILFCLADRGFRTSPRDVAAGLVVGALVAAAWLVTGWLGAAAFEPVPAASLSFVGPTASTLLYLMTASGTAAGIGVATVAGVVAGSFVSAAAAGQLRLQAFTGAPDMLRHVAGAALMGVGGTLALGCSIGQGISGVSTLSAGSLLALAAIMTGGVLGVRYLEHGSLSALVAGMLGGRTRPQ